MRLLFPSSSSPPPPSSSTSWCAGHHGAGCVRCARGGCRPEVETKRLARSRWDFSFRQLLLTTYSSQLLIILCKLRAHRWRALESINKISLFRQVCAARLVKDLRAALCPSRSHRGSSHAHQARFLHLPQYEDCLVPQPSSQSSLPGCTSWAQRCQSSPGSTTRLPWRRPLLSSSPSTTWSPSTGGCSLPLVTRTFGRPPLKSTTYSHQHFQPSYVVTGRWARCHWCKAYQTLATWPPSPSTCS